MTNLEGVDAKHILTTEKVHTNYNPLDAGDRNMLCGEAVINAREFFKDKFDETAFQRVAMQYILRGRDAIAHLDESPESVKSR